jgi:hypothetical protein
MKMATTQKKSISKRTKVNELSELGDLMVDDLNKLGYFCILYIESTQMITVYSDFDIKDWVTTIFFETTGVRFGHTDGITIEYADPEFPEYVYKRIKEIDSK